jgi:tetratricopeptide (TPR) repeat protein
MSQKPASRPTTFFCLALLASITFGGLNASSSSAQVVDGMSTVMELDGSRLAVSPDEMRALSGLGNLIHSDRQAAQNRALAAARLVANSRDARYALAVYELEIGSARGDDAMRARALDVLIASGLSPKARLPSQLAARGQIAFRAGEFDKAEALWTRLADLTPSNPDVFANLAQVKIARKDAQGAYDLLTRAIAMREVLNPKASEIWYRQRLSIAQQSRLVTSGIGAARALVNAYPSSSNWRAALVVYRDLAAPSGSTEVDLFRLMRYTGVLDQAAEYQRMAQLLRLAGEPEEAKTVLNEGLARGLLDARTSPTREIIAEVDRSVAKPRSGSAISKETVSGAGAQVRQGFAWLQAGKRTEAESEFRAATNDPGGGRYADLASFWLAFLKQSDAAATSAVP